MVGNDTPRRIPANIITEIMEAGWEDVEIIESGMSIEFIDLVGSADEDADEDDNDEGDGNGEGDDDSAFAPLGSAPDDSVLTFTMHKGSVFCCSLEPKHSLLAITGGEDDTAYLWDTSNNQVVMQLTGFNDSVIAAKFSHDGKYVAVADMSGIVKVLRIQRKPSQNQQQQQEQQELDRPLGCDDVTTDEVWNQTIEDIHWLRWHSRSHVLLCGTGEEPGHVYMWKIPGGDCKIMAGHGSPTEAGIFMPDGKRAAIGYKDGTMRIYDLTSCSMLNSLEVSDMASVISLDCHHDNNLIAVGTANGKVALYATQAGKLISMYVCTEDLSEEFGDHSSVESVVFSKDPSLPVLAIATTISVHIWDFSRQVLRQKLVITEGISMLSWYSPQQGTSSMIFVGCQEGMVKVIDAKSTQVMIEYLGHSMTVLDMSISRDGGKLLSVSDDNTAKVFYLDDVLMLGNIES